MAFASAFRRIFNGSSTPSLNIRSQFCSIRFSSTLPTLTSPKLFISGLSRTTSDDNLYKAFAPFGNLREAKIIIDRGSGKSRGFGFVTYDTVEEAEKAREGMNAKFLDGWVIFVDPAKPRKLLNNPLLLGETCNLLKPVTLQTGRLDGVAIDFYPNSLERYFVID